MRLPRRHGLGCNGWRAVMMMSCRKLLSRGGRRRNARGRLRQALHMRASARDT